MQRKKTLLFVSEDITLAQLVRLRVLASSLDPNQYNIHFASSSKPDMLFGKTRFEHWHLPNIGADKARKLIQNGKRLYEKDTLQSYVRDEFQLIDQIKPDLIIGDFRLSLSISAPVKNVRYAALINAYWSPFSQNKDFPMPDHPVESIINLSVAQKIFPYIRPWIFQHFCQPFNEVRKQYGLPAISSLREVVTCADHVLYADTRTLCPTDNLPSHHHYLGPVLWSPDNGLPDHLIPLLKEPYIYVTLGSSGRTDRYEELYKGLESLPATVLLAAAGRSLPKPPPNVILTDYVPGEVAARNALLVICNGGSTTGYQALYEGRPVIGLASNLDQYLCMKNLEKLGVGILLRAGSFQAECLHKAVKKITLLNSYRSAANNIKKDMEQHNSNDAFRKFVAATLN